MCGKETPNQDKEDACVGPGRSLREAGHHWCLPASLSLETGSSRGPVSYGTRILTKARMTNAGFLHVY